MSEDGFIFFTQNTTRTDGFIVRAAFEAFAVPRALRLRSAVFVTDEMPSVTKTAV